MTAPHLVVDRLGVERGSRQIVQELSFALAPGQVLAFIGPNGAGKSTVLKAVLGLIAHTGTVQLAGQDLARLDARARARLVGYVPQRSQLHAPMSVRNVVAMGRFAHQGMLARLHGADASAVDEAMRRTDTARLVDRPFSQLSVGEQSRVLIARALATGARTILLDEPTAALDVGHAMALLHLMRRLASDGCAILAVLHDLDQVAQVADHVLLLHEGATIAQGTPAEVLTAEHLGPVFCVEPVAGGATGFKPVGGGMHP